MNDLVSPLRFAWRFVSGCHGVLDYGCFVSGWHFV